MPSLGADVDEDAAAEANARISEWVRLLAARKGLKQPPIARALGISPGSLSQRLTGVLNWRAFEVDLLAEFFGVEPGLFFRDPDEALQIAATSPRRRRDDDGPDDDGAGFPLWG